MERILAYGCTPGMWCPDRPGDPAFPPGPPWWVHAWDAAVQHAGRFVLFVAVWAVVLLLIRAARRRGAS